MNFKTLDAKAKNIANNYIRLETELLEVLIEIYKTKAFFHLGYKSLYEYIHQALKISPATTYNIHGIVKKSCEVPELKAKIQAGDLSISKAAKMTSVLTPENKDHWFEMAKTKTHRQLEREVALSSPRDAVRERVTYVQPQSEVKEKVQTKPLIAKMALQVGVSEKLMLKLRRAQDLESSRLKKALNLEETMEQILDVYLDKRDPLKKAERSKTKTQQRKISPVIRQKLSSWEENRRERIKSSIIHKVYLRDQSRCTYVSASGERCSQQRFLQIHHIQPVSRGGGNYLKNLTLLCSGHHKMEHLVDERFVK